MWKPLNFESKFFLEISLHVFLSRYPDQVSISPTFYSQLFLVQKFSSKLFCTNIWGSNFFWLKNIGANALINCWWNWPQHIRLIKALKGYFFLIFVYVVCCVLNGHLMFPVRWHGNGRQRELFSLTLLHTCYVMDLNPVYLGSHPYDTHFGQLLSTKLTCNLYKVKYEFI